MPKLKNYKVRLMAVCDVLVLKAKSDQHAIELAQSEANDGDYEVLEMTTEEIKTPEALDSARRHCECVSEPDPR